MRYYDETMTDLGDWTAVRTALEPGAHVLEPRAGLELFRESRTLYILEQPGRWRARRRRGLHRLGFRPEAALRTVSWQWTVAEADLSATAERLHDTLGRRHDPTGVLQRLHRSMAADRLAVDQALRVLQEVFQVAATELTIVVPREDDFDDWEDDEEPLPDSWRTG